MNEETIIIVKAVITLVALLVVIEVIKSIFTEDD